MPKTVDWQRESVNGIGEEIDEHPADMLPPTLENENNSLETVNGCEHDDGDKRELSALGGNEIYEVSEVDDRCRKNESSKEIDKNDEPHTETAKSAHVVQ